VDAGKTSTYAGGVYLGGTGAANQLDDYEAGTWTPALSGGTAVAGTTVGSYKKVGELVTVSLYIPITTGGTVSQISGLPVNSKSGNDNSVGAGKENALTGNAWTFRCNASAATLLPRQYDNGTSVSTGAALIATITYQTA
jgi:hypothetical protein